MYVVSPLIAPYVAESIGVVVGVGELGFGENNFA